MEGRKMKIERLDESDAGVLHSHYQGQTDPQRAHIEIDLDDGLISAGINPEIGGGVPGKVWHGRIRRYPLPAGALPGPVNALMAEIAPVVEQMLTEYSCEWDGSNHVGRLTERGRESEQEIEAVIEGAELPTLAVWDAAEWCDLMTSQYVDALRTGRRTPDDIRDELEDEIEDGEGSPMVLEGIDQYVDALTAMASND
jgi:hypothetical protein